MKNNKINKLELIAHAGFQSKDKFTPQPGWQDEVIADIKRREHTGKFNNALQPQSLLQPRLLWRFAAVSLTIAILMGITLYLAVPDNSNEYQVDDFSFDNYDNYIEVIAQL